MSPVPPEFAAYVAPARARPALWRLIVGLLVVVVAAVASATIALAIVDVLSAGSLPSSRRARAAVAELAFLGSFVGIVFALFFVVHRLHRRAPVTLLGPPGRAFRHAVLASLAGGAAIAVAIVLSLPFDGLERQMATAVWVGPALAAIPLIIVQVSAEEMVFRGYLVQQLAARFTSPNLWAVLPAALFGVAHFNPDLEANVAAAFVLWAFVFAMLATDLTVRTGSLGAAIGFHFAMNLVALLLVGTKGLGPAPLALAVGETSLADPAAFPWLITLGVISLVATYAAVRWVVMRSPAP